MELFISCINSLYYIQLAIPLQIVHYARILEVITFLVDFLKSNIKMEIHAKNNLAPFIVLNPI